MKHAPNPQLGVLGTPPIEDNKPKWEEKLATLRAQRRAHGLCMKCGEKWGRNHKCPEKILLQVLEEFMEILPEDPPSDHSSAVSSDDEQVFALSQCAAVGVQGKKTIKINGLVNNQEILILIDSGSSSTFINESIAAALKCIISSAPPIQVTVANGEKLLSNQ